MPAKAEKEEGEKMKRTPFTPTTGRTYHNIGGGSFECLDVTTRRGYTIVTMQNVKSGWTFTAHGCGIYEDGSIDWDYSKNGRFEKIGQ